MAKVPETLKEIVDEISGKRELLPFWELVAAGS